MKPKAQRIAIAKACGWKEVSYGVGPNSDLCLGDMPRWTGNKITSYLVDVVVPDYLNDLNAMYEAEKIIAREKLRYSFFLYLGKNGGNNHEWTKIHSTAAQRAEAFLRAMDLWEEPKKG